jgi:hypothetical protein
MEILPAIFAEINSCEYFFLRSITEPEENILRLIIEEAGAGGPPVPLKIGDTVLGEGIPITSTGDSRLFEITWNDYIAYSVRNESYATTADDEKVAWGKRVREYSKSRFLDYISQATFASAEYPGPFQHIQIVSENHIIDVGSTKIPRIQRLRPKEPLGD